MCWANIASGAYLMTIKSGMTSAPLWRGWPKITRHRLILIKGEIMNTDELERAAYAAGDTERAGLLARIDELTRALGEAVAEIESLRKELGYIL